MSKASPETDTGGEVGLSAIVPLYNEERSVAELVERLVDSLVASARCLAVRRRRVRKERTAEGW